MSLPEIKTIRQPVIPSKASVSWSGLLGGERVGDWADTGRVRPQRHHHFSDNHQNNTHQPKQPLLASACETLAFYTYYMHTFFHNASLYPKSW